jgi:hypothetical protein
MGFEMRIYLSPLRNVRIMEISPKEPFPDIMTFWSGLILQYLILLPIVVSLFRPLHFPQYFLGFILGMAFNFGGVLTVMFGTGILLMCFIVYKIYRQCCFLYQES